MPPANFLVGEFRRTLDERYRLTIPNELADRITTETGTDCVLAKESVGSLSLWKSADWKASLDKEIVAVQALLESGRLKDRLDVVQKFGRLLSTRQREVQMAGRSRLSIPEGFREFLGVEPGGEVFVVGAALCIEIWRPDAWFRHLQEEMPQFKQMGTIGIIPRLYKTCPALWIFSVPCLCHYVGKQVTMERARVAWMPTFALPGMSFNVFAKSPLVREQRQSR